MCSSEFTEFRSEEPACSAASVMSDSLQPHGLQPARLLCPWNSPDKNTGVGHMPSSRGSSQTKDQTCVSFFGSGFFTPWATWEARAGHRANPISLDSKVHDSGIYYAICSQSWLHIGIIWEIFSTCQFPNPYPEKLNQYLGAVEQLWRKRLLCFGFFFFNSKIYF